MQHKPHSNTQTTSQNNAHSNAQTTQHNTLQPNAQRTLQDQPLYQIGIDCGSKTVKVCISNTKAQLLHSVYRRHRSNIKTTLSEVIHELIWRYGNISGTVAITGSAGISVARALGLPFVQEVVATTKMVKQEYPHTNCVIELGGEDAKIIYLTGGLEQRMNATCAGGTGGFIDNIAYLLGVRTGDIDKLSMGASRSYPIASRCAVFAQTDIRPLMNAGARTSDLARSTLDAVVRQTLGGLACGRPITGTVVFLGGPFEFISDLAVRFRKALNLNNETGICPANAQFFTARGAGLYGATCANIHTTSLQALEQQLEQAQFDDSSLERLPALFETNTQREAFQTRHREQLVERENIFTQAGPVYVGIDAGSTAVKVAVVNQNGAFIWGDSQENRGDVLKTTTELLCNMYASFPSEYHGPACVHVAHATATGYGEDLLKACLGVDSGVVETTAHVQGALSFAPQLSFLLDIGGQDMKAIWVKDGLVQNAVLNEACSSGCGSFLSGTAYALRLQKENFAAAALEAKSPVDLGTKCTVFMNSRLKHAQKVGANTNDLAAGCAYSVVKNALFRIIGLDSIESLGNTIVVQGGTFMNDAVLRAFELLVGKEVLRPNRANLMGAFGAALVARKRALAAEAQAENTLATHVQAGNARVKNTQAHSTLLSREELEGLAPERSTRVCEGCANSCTLSVVTVAAGASGAGSSGNAAGSASGDAGASDSATGDNDSEAGGASGDAAAGTSDGAGDAAGTHGASDGTGDSGTPAGGERTFISGNRCGKALELYTTSQRNNQQHAPNALAVQRALIHRLPNCTGKGKRARVRIGIMNTLLTYEYTPFWHEFFRTLGFSVLLPHEQTQSVLRTDAAGADTVPSESVCYPAKLSHKRLQQLSREGATHVFAPVYARGENCPVSAEYALALRDGARLTLELANHMISPHLAHANPQRIAASAEAKQALLCAVEQLVQEAENTVCAVELTAELSSEFSSEFEHALQAGLTAQSAHETIVRTANEKVLAWVERSEQHHGIMLLGRPYHTDAATGHCIDEVLSHLGLAVLAPNVLTKEDAPRVERSCNTSKSACVWKKASHMVRLAHYAVQHKRIDVVALHSFGCLYDSVNIIEVADYLHKHGRLFTALKVDEIADTAHVRIRLRTLAENIEQLGLAHTSAQNASANAGNSSAGNSSASNAESCERTAPASNAESCERTAPASNTEPCECIAPASNANTSNSQSAALAQPPAAKTFTAPLSPQLVRYAEHGSIKAFAHLCAADIEAARSHTRDLCYSTAAIVGRSLRILSSCPALVALTLPNVCHNCTLEAVPYLLERITGRALTITWENSWPLPPTAIDQPPAPAMPLVGILGTAPLVFDSYLNDHLASVITAHGCTPVFPECEALFTNDIQYLDQLQHFYDCGVRHVIYLQSFGCLKGHVHVRGSMHALAQRFPGMNLVVLDYDPEASALNRENRVLLTLAAALGI